MKIIALQNVEILIDENDFEKVLPFSWWIKPNGYVYTQVKRKTIYLHRLIMDAKEGQEIDHINHNKLDNRKSNLRFCTRSQNNMNKAGIRGVSTFRGKWRARIKINKQEIHVGVFDTIEEAINARKNAEGRLFGNFANI